MQTEYESRYVHLLLTVRASDNITTPILPKPNGTEWGHWPKDAPGHDQDYAPDASQ